MSETVRAVVIGGAGDGRHIVTLGQQTLELMEAESLPPLGAYEDSNFAETVEAKRHRYRLEVIRSGSRRFALYVLDGISHEDAMQMLIDGYRSAKA